MSVRPIKPEDGGEATGFDMTSMIDVTFLLIIFFMCVTELADVSKSVLTLPEAEMAEPATPNPGRLMVNILEDGRAEILGRPYAWHDVGSLIDTEARISRGERTILLRADQSVRFHFVQRFMSLCRQKGLYKIAFMTKPQAEQM